MKNADKLLKKIEELRKEMNEMISLKGNLQDSEIIEVSEHLDRHLADYYRLLKMEKE